MGRAQNAQNMMDGPNTKAGPPAAAADAKVTDNFSIVIHGWRHYFVVHRHLL
jgi:hypothetical protein